MLERDFQKRITDMADRFGWSWWHIPAPMISAGGEWRPYKKGAGVPDLILTHANPPRLVFMELKGDGGTLSDNQRGFLQAAKNVADNAAELIYLDGGDEVQRVAAVHERPVGVYAFWPKDEPLVEQLLRSRRLT
jgi:hypothetical protein